MESRLSDSRGSYGSVVNQEDVRNKRSRARAVLVCGTAFVLLIAAAALVVGIARANNTPPKSTPGVISFAAAVCDEQEKPVPPTSCAICISTSATPQTLPSQCPAGTYWDEEETCSCIPCEKNCCCLAGDVMNACPVGSFQPNKGGKTCLLIAVGSVTNEFEYNPIARSVLNTQPATPQKLLRTLRSPVSCSDVPRKSVVMVTGMNLNSGDSRVSMTVRVERQNGANTDVSISKVGGSRIEGAAFGVVETCLGADSIMTMGRVKAMNIKKGMPEKRTLVTNLECGDFSSPRVFAGIDEFDAVGLNQAFSLSVSASVRTNHTGFVRPRLEFSTSGSGIVSAGAGVVAYCYAEATLFGQGYIVSGTIDGSAFSLEAGTNMYISRNVEFENEMKCSQPQVSLALTQLEVAGGIALNLELMASTSKSFTMRFVAMGNTKIKSVKAAYLATCNHDVNKVAQAVKETCGLLTPQVPVTLKPTAKPSAKPTSVTPTTPKPTGKPTRTQVTIPPTVTHVKVEAQWTGQRNGRVDLDIGANIYSGSKVNSGWCYFLKKAYPASGQPAVLMGTDNKSGGKENMEIFLNRVPSRDEFIVVSLVIYQWATSFQELASCKVVLTDLGANKVIATFDLLDRNQTGNAMVLAYFKREKSTGRWSYVRLGKMLTTKDVYNVEKMEKYMEPVVAKL